MKVKEIKRTSEKKGISLIVLVITIIVIIILAVAVILSIANNNPIENAKEARFRNDMKVIEEELNLYIAKKYADNLGTNTEVVNLDGEKMVKALPSTKDYKDKVKIVGGNLELTGSASKKEKEWAEKIGIEVGVEETVTLKVGDEVTYKGEPFYIIGGDTVDNAISTSTRNVLLLAKYNLKKENGKLIQDTSGAINECSFCSESAWLGASVATGDNLNEKTTISSETTSAVSKAITYGKDIFGVAGRLMLYEEATKLQTKYSEILYGKNTEKGYLGYWLGSADSAGSLWGVLGERSSLGNSDFGGVRYYGVRPVIEVPKSSIN